MSNKGVTNALGIYTYMYKIHIDIYSHTWFPVMTICWGVFKKIANGKWWDE